MNKLLLLLPAFVLMLTGCSNKVPGARFIGDWTHENHQMLIRLDPDGAHFQLLIAEFSNEMPTDSSHLAYFKEGTLLLVGEGEGPTKQVRITKNGEAIYWADKRWEKEDPGNADAVAAVAD